MSDDSELNVSFTADTSDLEDGAEAAAGFIDGFKAHVADVAPLADQLAAISAITTEFYGQMAASAASANQKVTAGAKSAADQYAQVWKKPSQAWSIASATVCFVWRGGPRVFTPSG